MAVVDEVKEWIAKGALILDVRTPEEFEEASFPGAVLIPLQELDKRFGELSDLAVPIVLYCRSGIRSENALQFLKSKGYKNLINAGGLKDMPKS